MFKKALRSSAILVLAVLLAEPAVAQCTDQVTHVQGMQVVGGTEVTVTSVGLVDTLSTFCSGSIAPYLVGVQTAGQVNGTGAYIFQFDPPVDSAMINVGGLSGDGPDLLEAIRLSVDGVHYAVPDVGQAHACEDMAMLTPDGDITGCEFCYVSGWDGTVIPGPITTLTVQDTVWYEGAGGSVFSLFICGGAVGGIGIPEERLLGTPYPNPASDHIYIDVPGSGMRAVVVDATGRATRELMLSAGTNSIPLSGLCAGAYGLRLSSGQVLRFLKD